HAVAVSVVAEVVIARVRKAQRVAKLVVQRMQAIETRVELRIAGVEARVGDPNVTGDARILLAVARVVSPSLSGSSRSVRKPDVGPVLGPAAGSRPHADFLIFRSDDFVPVADPKASRGLLCFGERR